MNKCFLRRMGMWVAAISVLATIACSPERGETGVTFTPPGPASAARVADVGRSQLATAQAPEQVTARAMLRPTASHMTSGVVEFTEAPDGALHIVVEIAQLDEGSHGLHIHEIGDCSAPDASSAGPHFSPNDHPHGSPSSAAHHAGDLGNIQANPDRIAVNALDTSDLTLSGRTSVIGRAVVVHQNADDFVTQPSGDSGDRIACGVIRATGRPEALTPSSLSGGTPKG